MKTGSSHGPCRNGFKQFTHGRITGLASPSVYEPHEDSALLADAAASEAFGDVLDMGCGTGLAGISAALNGKTKSVAFADVSSEALKLAEKNCGLNKVAVPTKFVKTNLFEKITAKYDAVLFNPPYLPTDKNEKLRGSINSAFDGGATGRRVIDPFLKQFASHLKPGGILLLLNSSVSSSGEGNGNKETIEKLEGMGFGTETIKRQKFFFEEIVVVKAFKR